MARFVLLVLLVVGGALVVALYFDRRGRRDEPFDRLRQAFLHGTLLPGHPRSTSLVEFTHPAGLRFRAPGSWKVEMREGQPSPPVTLTGSVRHVEVEVVRLERTAAGSVADVLKNIPSDGERTVDSLPNGHVLMKSVEPASGPGGPLASYTWRLGRAAPRGGLELAVFRLRLPVDAATEVIALADVATLEREVREATFSDTPGAPGGV